MDRLTCYFDNETAVLRDCCTFDRESGTEPDDCISCREMCEIKDGECSECPIQKAFNKLAEHEDLEKNGQLLKLPCKVGDTLYTVNRGEIISMVVCEISVFSLNSDDVQIKCTESSSYGFLHYSAKNIGDIIFLTRDEAETALKRAEDHCAKTEG